MSDCRRHATTPGIALRCIAGMRRPRSPALRLRKGRENMCVSTDAQANPKAIAHELAIINDSATAKEQPVLVELVSQLHAASSAADLSALHTKLLARYLARQRFRGELELDKSRVESEIRELAARSPKPIDDLRARQEELKRPQDGRARPSRARRAHAGDRRWRRLEGARLRPSRDYGPRPWNACGPPS